MAVTESSASTAAAATTTKEGGDVASTSTKAVKQPLVKIVIRRLPYTMTAEELLEQLAPIPDHEYFYFSKADASMHPWAYNRAYFGFRKDSDVLTFRDRFNGYVFVDAKGTESMALVELAPNPKIPKQSSDRSKNADSKCGTLEDDVDYKKFVTERENPEPVQVASLEQRLKEVEEKAKMKRENEVQETPLVQFLLQKKEEKWRRQLDKRRQREEERKRRQAERVEQERREREQRKKEKEKREREKEREKEKEGDREKDKDRDRDRDKDKDREREREREKRKEHDSSKPQPSRSSADRKKPDHQVAPRFAKSKPPTATAYREDADSAEAPSSTSASNKPHSKSTEKAAKPPRFEREEGRKTASADAKPSKPARNDESGSTQQRRSKARPERELYQPGQRKRVVAATTTDTSKKAEQRDAIQE